MWPYIVYFLMDVKSIVCLLLLHYLGKSLSLLLIQYMSLCYNWIFYTYTITKNETIWIDIGFFHLVDIIDIVSLLFLDNGPTITCLLVKIIFYTYTITKNETIWIDIGFFHIVDIIHIVTLLFLDNGPTIICLLVKIIFIPILLQRIRPYGIDIDFFHLVDIMNIVRLLFLDLIVLFFLYYYMSFS